MASKNNKLQEEVEGTQISRIRNKKEETPEENLTDSKKMRGKYEELLYDNRLTIPAKTNFMKHTNNQLKKI